MATQSSTREKEIKAIHIKYEDFYRIGGGLFVVLILIIIGSWIFGQNAFGFEGDFLGYVTNVATEFLSVVGTVIVVDQLNRRRNRQERKLELFDQVKSRSNDMAVDALEKIKRAGWIAELIEYHTVSGVCDFSQVKWSGGIILEGVNLQGANFRNADLQGANFRNAKLQEASLSGANLQYSDFENANLQGARLWETNLQGAELSCSNLQQAFMRYANLQEANLIEANLHKADLKYAILQEAYLNNSNLSEANLVAANLQNAGLDGANLEKTNLVSANLQGAGIEKANLQYASLSANLRDAYLQGANLKDADLIHANLRGAQFNQYTQFNAKTVLPDATFIGLKMSEIGIGIESVYTKYWNPDTNMSHYTDSNHPDFWQSNWEKEDDTD